MTTTMKMGMIMTTITKGITTKIRGRPGWTKPGFFWY
jgi:hypothetical protein